MNKPSETPIVDALYTKHFHTDCGAIGDHPDWTVPESSVAPFIAQARQLERQNVALMAYAECEEARSQSEDIAETVLRRHGFNPAECTAIYFMDRMRRAALQGGK